MAKAKKNNKTKASKENKPTGVITEELTDVVEVPSDAKEIIITKTIETEMSLEDNDVELVKAEPVGKDTYFYIRDINFGTHKVGDVFEGNKKAKEEALKKEWIGAKG